MLTARLRIRMRQGGQARMARKELTAARVKEMALELGADLVGIASADTLNAFPPDPQWPQTPDRVSPYCRSVIVVALNIPVAVFRCKLPVAVQYMDQTALRRMDSGAYGYCVRCDEEIAPARLELDPAVATCIVCASRS